MTIELTLEELHRLSFADEDTAVYIAEKRNMESYVLCSATVSPLTAYYAAKSEVSAYYLSFAAAVLSAINVYKFNVAEQELCLRIQRAIASKLGSNLKPDKSFEIDDLYALNPFLNLKQLMPRNMNDVLYLLGASQEVHKCLGLFYGHSVFADSPAAIRYKFVGNYLVALQYVEAHSLAPAQQFRLKAAGFAEICMFTPRLYCEHISNTPAEIAGIVYAVDAVGRAGPPLFAKAEFLWSQLEKTCPWLCSRTQQLQCAGK